MYCISSRVARVRALDLVAAVLAERHGQQVRRNGQSVTSDRRGQLADRLQGCALAENHDVDGAPARWLSSYQTSP